MEILMISLGRAAEQLRKYVNSIKAIYIEICGIIKRLPPPFHPSGLTLMSCKQSSTLFLFNISSTILVHSISD
jgi:hypothetical protein